MQIWPLLLAYVTGVCMLSTRGVSKDRQHALRQHKHEVLSMSQEEKSPLQGVHH